MALIIKDRIKEVTTTTGTGDIVLGGSSATYDSFGSCMSNGDTMYYAIVHTVGGTDEWEVGLGTYNSTTDAIARTTIIASSNAGSAVNFSAGPKNIFITNPADKAVYLNADGNIDLAGTIDGRDLSVDGAKLDGIEAGATADQTKADIDALNIDADLLDGQHGSYYTSYTDTAIANLVDSSPATLDTLNELAAALGDDPNFATTVTNSIATKLPLAGGTLTGNLDVTGTISANDLTLGDTNPTIRLNDTDGTDNYTDILQAGNSLYYTARNGTGFGGHVFRGYNGTNTYPRFGINTLGDSLFYNDTGTEKMRWDASAERLGIGTSSPSQALELASSSPTVRLSDTDGTNQYTDITQNSAALTSTARNGTSHGAYSWRSTDGTNTYTRAYLNASGQFTWYDDVNNQKMRWDSTTARLGIGTTSPSTTLEAYGGATDTIISVKTNTNGQSTFDGASAGVQLIAGAMNSTSKYTPSLQFGSYDSDFTTDTPRMGASIVGRARQAFSADTAAAMALDFYTTPINAGAGQQAVHAMTIDHDGFVGIGTDNPSTTLDVAGAVSADNNITVSRSTVAPSITFSNSNYAGGDASLAYFDVGSLLFRTNGTEQMRIDADGNVGINKTQPSEALDVSGNIQASGSIDGEVTKIRAWDVRSSSQVPGSDGTSDYMPAPNDEWLDKSTRTLFSTDGGEGTWSGILSTKAWNGTTYGGWQLGGTAGTTTWDDLYFRDGVGGSWGAWRKLWHDGNDDTLLKTTGGTMTGNLTISNGTLTATTIDASAGLEGEYIGVGNTSNSTGRGISLYNGPSSGLPSYGIAFAGTGTFGTHGSVTGDWATYLTMTNTTGRGWVFKNTGTGNVASISNTGVADFNSVTMTTSTGSGTFGSTNTSWFHMTTDRPSFYMNKGLKAAGDIGVYNTNTYLTGSDLYLDGVIRHYGDTNTYMQFHAADQWRVVVGNVERLEVTTTGVGIKGAIPSVALDVNGSIEYTGTITDVSDDRLKENKVQITGALNAIKSLTGYTYNMVYEDEEQTEMGLIAQDVQAVLPVAVKNIKIDTDGDGTDEDYLGVSYIQLIAPMIEAMKEQQQQIEALEARIAVLEG